MVPTHHDDLEPLLAAELAALDRRIRSARARETHWQLHGYSRLEAIVSPISSGDLAEQAATFLGRLHGECFGDGGAIRGDLAWPVQR